jgi:hypothetical protein
MLITSPKKTIKSLRDCVRVLLALLAKKKESDK